jgi:hypothetical protein
MTRSKSGPNAQLVVDRRFWPVVIGLDPGHAALRALCYSSNAPSILSESLDETGVSGASVSLAEQTHLTCRDKNHARKSTCSSAK